MTAFTAFEGYTQSRNPPNNPEPKTNDPGKPHPNQSKIFTKAAPQQRPGKIPKNSVLNKMSALARFRQTPAYRKLRDKVGHQDTDGQKPMQQSATFTPANLKERAEVMIDYVQGGGRVDNLFRLANGHRLIVESLDDFADSIIALLVDAGFDDNLVEVEAEGKAVMIYLDEYTSAKHKDVRSVLAEIANVELISNPDDNPELGTYIYKVEPHDGKDTSRTISQIADDPVGKEAGTETKDSGPKKESRKARKREDQIKPRKPNSDGTAPQPDTRNKKGKRVMHDAGECFSPAKKEAKNGGALSAVPHVKKGEWFDTHDQVWVVDDNVPMEVTVIEVKNLGDEWGEAYICRRDDGSIREYGRRSAHSTREAAVKEANKYRSPGDKIESELPMFKETLDEALGNNPAPRAGDLIIDGTTRIPFKVNRVLTASKVEVIDNPNSNIPVGTLPTLSQPKVGVTSLRQVDVRVIEAGLTSGSMQRIKTEEVFTEAHDRPGRIAKVKASIAKRQKHRDYYSKEMDQGSVPRSVIKSYQGHTKKIMKGQDIVAKYGKKKEALHTCPNCVVPLKQEGTSFLCSTCSFVAEFADVGSE